MWTETSDISTSWTPEESGWVTPSWTEAWDVTTWWTDADPSEWWIGLYDEEGFGLYDEEGFELIFDDGLLFIHATRTENIALLFTEDEIADYDYGLLLDYDDDELEATIDQYGTNRSEIL